MNRRYVLPGVLALCLGIGGCGSSSNDANSAQAKALYQSKSLQIVQQGVPGLLQSVGAILDLSPKANWPLAQSDAAKGLARLQKARKDLGRLAVPPDDRDVQRLLKQGLDTYVRGAEEIKHGADAMDIAAMQKGSHDIDLGTPYITRARRLLTSAK